MYPSLCVVFNKKYLVLTKIKHKIVHERKQKMNFTKLRKKWNGKFNFWPSQDKEN